MGGGDGTFCLGLRELQRHLGGSDHPPRRCGLRRRQALRALGALGLHKHGRHHRVAEAPVGVDDVVLEGALGERVLEHVPLEVGALAGHLQQQVGGQAQEAALDLARVQRAEHGQHPLQGGGGEALLVTPEVAHVEPANGIRREVVFFFKQKRVAPHRPGVAFLVGHKLPSKHVEARR